MFLRSKTLKLIETLSFTSKSLVKTSVLRALTGKIGVKTEVFPIRNLATTLINFNVNTPETNNNDIPLSPDMEALCKDDVEIGKLVRKILMEYEMLKLTASDVPSTLTAKHMKKLLAIPSSQGRIKLFRALFLRELYPILDKEKKERNRVRRLEEKQEKVEMSNGHLEYGLNANTLFFYIQPSSMNRWFVHRQTYALQFGQPLVYDLSFEKHMTKRELTNLVVQLQYAHGENKLNHDPFNLYFTNVDFNSETYSLLKLAMPQIIEDVNNMITVTDKSYLELFQKKKLVYFSPDAPKSLEKFDHDAIYIIGGIVDKGTVDPLTLAKAKRERIEMVKLPLDENILFAPGAGKALTLNQMMQILLRVKTNQNWKEALLAGIPRRSLRRVSDIQEEQSKRQERFLKGQKNVAKRKQHLEINKMQLFDKNVW